MELELRVQALKDLIEFTAVETFFGAIASATSPPTCSPLKEQDVPRICESTCGTPSLGTTSLDGSIHELSDCFLLDQEELIVILPGFPATGVLSAALGRLLCVPESPVRCPQVPCLFV